MTFKEFLNETVKTSRFTKDRYTIRITEIEDGEEFLVAEANVEHNRARKQAWNKSVQEALRGDAWTISPQTHDSGKGYADQLIRAGVKLGLEKFNSKNVDIVTTKDLIPFWKKMIRRHMKSLDVNLWHLKGDSVKRVGT